jgi:hypothetical protein
MDPGVSMGVGNVERGRRSHWLSARRLSNRPLKHHGIDQPLAAVIEGECKSSKISRGSGRDELR